MGYKDYLGWLTIGLAVISYGFYFRNIIRGKTKPHSISWLVWAVLSGVTFLTQRSNGAGAGGWITGFTAVMATLIFITSIFRGERNITRLDWLCVAGAMVSLSFWYLDNQGLQSVIFACITFIIGFVPTFYKSYFKPRQETAITFFLNGTKFLLAIAALKSFSAETVLYPVVVSIMNLGFVFMLLARRGMTKS